MQYAQMNGYLLLQLQARWRLPQSLDIFLVSSLISLLKETALIILESKCSLKSVCLWKYYDWIMYDLYGLMN